MTKSSTQCSAWNCGEFGLIDRIRCLFPDIDLTDDCATIDVPLKQLLITTDTTVRGVHFPDGSGYLHNAGFKALAGAASDINASAGLVHSALLALNIPQSLTLGEFDDFLDGVLECSKEFDIPIVGGNIARCEHFSATISVIGISEKPISRSGAQVGDTICISGATGGSEAGRMIAMSEVERFYGDHKKMVEQFFRPSPQFGLGRSLAEIGATAMIDISDGLVADSAHIAEASGVKLRLNLENIPQFEGLDELARFAKVSPYDIVSVSGEEYLLVFTIASEKVLSAENLCPSIAPIGEVLKGSGIELLLNNKVFPLGKTGWRHF